MTTKSNELEFWTKPTEKGELVNYVARQRGAQVRLIEFENGDALAECFRVNAGKGKPWGEDYNFTTDEEQVNDWTFGKMRTLGATREAISSGNVTDMFMDRVEKMRNELYEKYPSIRELEQFAVTTRRRRVFSEDAEELCIDRYMSGDPAMFTRMSRQQQRNRTATFYIDVAVSAGTSSNTIADGIITTLALADIVERAGISTKIVVGYSSNGVTSNVNTTVIAVTAKNAGEPLDVSRVLSFALSGVYRNYIFAVWSKVIDKGEYVDSGLGRANVDMNDPIFKELGAVVKVKAADAFWTNEQRMEIMIDGLTSYLKGESAVTE